MVDAEFGRLCGKLAVVDIALAHHHDLEGRKFGKQDLEHVEELPHALLLVQAPADGDHRILSQPARRAKRRDGFGCGQFVLQANRVVHAAVHRQAVRAQHIAELVGHDRQAIDVALEHLANQTVATGTVTQPLARDALAPIRGVIAQLAARGFATVKARQLLIAKRHHVVRGEHHARAGRLGRRQRRVGNVRVDQVRMHDVGSKLGQHALELLDDLGVVQTDPSAPTRVVVRMHADERNAQLFGLPHQLGIRRRRKAQDLVATRAQLFSVLVHLAHGRADALIPQVIEKQDAH